MEVESPIVFWPASLGATFQLKLKEACAERREESVWTLLCWQLSDPCWLAVVSSELLGDFKHFSFIALSPVLGLRSSKVKLSFLVV